MSSKRTIAIVGAGFCGTTVAVNLLRASPASVGRILLVERVERQIGGVAYSTTSGSHTLNVPAGRMSAFEDDPDDFLRFVRASDPSLTGGSFVPRRTYGEYLAARLDEARRACDLPLVRVAGEVVAIAEATGAARLTLADGRVLDVDGVVLAIGNFPPADPRVEGDEIYASLRYARDPWSPDALELDRREDVLLLGTGLTMCDVALALRDLDHRGRIYAVSRRGLLPQPHRVSAVPPPHLDAPSDLEAWPDTAIGMLRALRREVRDKAADAVDWREVVTSIRGDTPALWQRLDVDGAPKVSRAAASVLGDAPSPIVSRDCARPSSRSSRPVRSRSSRAASSATRRKRTAVVVTLRRRGATSVEALRVGKVINCTGPDTDLARVNDPLVQDLRRAGLIRPDELGLGLDTDEHGRLLDADGRPSERLFLVGPLRKGQLWENTAVPELREEARRMATLLGAG